MTTRVVRRPAAPTIARAAIGIAVVILASRAWFLFHRAIDVDEFEHAHAAWCVASGMVPYRDFFEHHTPGLYFAFAPVFASAPVDRDADAALRTLRLCRGAMFALTIASVVLTYGLGRLWGGPPTAAIATLLLVTSQQFLDSMLEFRPDVPAVAFTLLAIVCAISAGEKSARPAAALAFASGALFTGALLCTQKALFAAPGILFPIAAARRAPIASAWLAGCLLPAAIVLSWFASRQALEPFLIANVATNVRLNADRFATLPRLLRHVAHDPALYLCGFAGTGAALCSRWSGIRRLTIAAGAISLLAGAFVIGRPYDQYYSLLLPLLAAAGAGWAQVALRTRPWWLTGPVARALPWAAAIGGTAAFFALVRPLSVPQNAAMALCFSAAAVLAAAAAQLWDRRQTASALCGMGAVTALLAGNLAREFTDNRQQIADLRWVTGHTDPSDTVLSGYQSVAAFRPHAWFYFYLTGPFPTAEDYAVLLEGMKAGRVRPRLVVFNATLTAAPAPLLEFIRRHYRPVRGDILERIDP